MTVTRFWLIRHALVDPEARKTLYGIQDVPVCAETMAAQGAAYTALGRRLPQPARWFVTPLSRTRLTAEAVFAGGYPAQELHVEPGMIEQGFGSLQGTPNAVLHTKLALPKHDFWPISAAERPHEGESFEDVIGRVGHTIERLAREHGDADLVIVCHGGTIRAAMAHALGIRGDSALRLTVGNISLTRLERRDQSWRVIAANETMDGVPAF